jgi:hypothetical protein
MAEITDRERGYHEEQRFEHSAPRAAQFEAPPGRKQQPPSMAHLLKDQGLRETRMDAPNVYFSPGASTTAASAVSSRKVKVSCKYSSTIVLEWLK